MSNISNPSREIKDLLDYYYIQLADMKRHIKQGDVTRVASNTGIQKTRTYSEIYGKAPEVLEGIIENLEEAYALQLQFNAMDDQTHEV